MRLSSLVLGLALTLSSAAWAAPRLASTHASARSMIMLANAKAKAKKPAKTTSAQGFGAKKSEPFPPPVQDLIKACKSLARDAAEQDSAAADTQRWFQLAAAAAQLEEYAEARVLLEAGIEHCGAENAEMLVRALGQMRRTGPSPALEAEGVALAWPGKGDESKYAAGETRFERLSAPAWPNDCPRGTYYPTGHAAIAVSTTPVLPPDECAWVVSQAERVAKERWMSDHSDATKKGADMIWTKGFPDRLWLREVPGLVEWFEHRLRTRLFPMLQSLYPEAIPTADVLRCHDAFISRYTSEGMNSLEVHQDTTDFTFTIALNPSSEYEGGGTLFPNVRPADADNAQPFANHVAAPEVGCVVSFPGRLHHGGHPITSGVRYIIPLFIYLDRNKLTDRERGYLLHEAGIVPAAPAGLDVFSKHLNAQRLH
jgi:hypothetical protein